MHLLLWCMCAKYCASRYITFRNPKQGQGVEILRVEILRVEVLRVEVLRVEVLRVEILRVDILRVDILRVEVLCGVYFIE